jgi:hypothetical protein
MISGFYTAGLRAATPGSRLCNWYIWCVMQVLRQAIANLVKLRPPISANMMPWR